MLGNFITLAMIIAVVFVTLAKGDDCLVSNYDTMELELCADQNLTLNPNWKEFY